MTDITWEVFTQYAGLGVVTGISLGSLCIFWSFFISRVRSTFTAAMKVGDL